MIRFTKGHAYGNDFLYVARTEVEGIDWPELARQMCHRTTGIGADGLILFTPLADGASMALYNSDGSLAEVSGNGVRALAALLGMQRVEQDVHLTIHTDGGVKRLVRLDRDHNRQLFRADMGVPRDLRRLRLEAAGETIDGIALDMGNPQFIVLGSIPDDERFNRLGAALEHHPAFPNGTNIEFVEVEAVERVRIRIWERGCGPTSSSGTGSCASLVAAATFAGASRSAEVVAPGGTQRVEWREDAVYLTGWAEVLCEGGWQRPLPQRQ